MDARTLRVLEYDAIRQRLAARAACSLGKELARALTPATTRKEVQRLLDETQQARDLVAEAGRPPLGGAADVRAQVRAASRGGALAPRDLLDIANTVHASRRMRAFLRQAEERAPLLAERAPRLGVFPEIEESIARAIDHRGEVLDTAGEELRAIRARMRRLQDSIARRLQSIIHSAAYARLLQEPIITVRNGRYCVPVRSEFKGEFRGIVHDSSASGATVFMEPFAVVQVNNELREAQAAEEHEVARVLARLSAQVGEQADEILESIGALAELDLIFARAGLAEEMKAIRPELDAGGRLELFEARHPLLEGKVVPIDIRIGDEFRALIITGPNTGGKTVTLKTVGLLALMAQSGLHLPAAGGSRLPVFRRVFADIGDEQSIQQNLSTFSSHMTQVVNVLEHADGDSLVLLDEIGAGTDPAEGAALAKAIIMELVGRGARVLATTHYGELKVFAYAQPEVENASVLFDPVTLEPTYEVQIGAPGSSNAFAIASRLGLSAELLRQAAEMMGESQVRLYEVIERAERDQRDLSEERRQTARMRMDLEKTKAEYERMLADLRAERKRRLREAREEARRIVARAKQRTEELLNLLRRSVQEAREAKDAIAREAELIAKYAPTEPAETPEPPEPGAIGRAAKEELEGISAEANEATEEVAEPPEPAPPAPPPPAAEELSPGAWVLVRSVNQRGTVLSPPDQRDEVEVQVGILKLRVPRAELAPAEEPAVTVSWVPPEQRPYGAQVPGELHLRGMRVEAAIYELEKYLDQAALAHHAQVRIVHGKGLGKVRAAVHERLREHPLVRSFRLAEPEHGGSGVTVVELGEGER